jgi:hypothetical protein
MRYPVFLIEATLFVSLVAGGLWFFPRRAWAERGFSRLTRLPVPGWLAAFLASFLLAAALSAVVPPAPSIHDELSYELAAETFAAGRLTNPPHPMWRHFESFHILQQPTYQSRYPPGQGLFMALGVLAGHPIVGVWLSMGAAAAAIYWALGFWMPARWAMFGALLPVLRFGGLATWDLRLYAYWATSYWGGAVALMGGALAFGAAARLYRAPSARNGLVFAAGLGVLALTRPYEGLCLSLPLGVLALRGCIHSRQWRPIAAAGCVLASVVAFLALHNASVTGDVARFPYAEYADQYDFVPTMRHQDLDPEPQYRHEIIRRYFTGFRVRDFNAQLSGWGLDRSDVERNWRFYLGVILTPACLAGFLWRSPWMIFSGSLLLMGVVSHTVAGAANLRPHYFAPFAPPLLLLTVQGLRTIKTWRFSRLGLPAVQAIVATVALSWAGAAALRVGLLQPDSNVYEEKRAVLERLSPEDAKHLVIVHYGPTHSVHEEWVYNDADIDASPVVWARSMSPEQNRELIRYYADRRVWSVWPDEEPPRIERYQSP